MHFNLYSLPLTYPFMPVGSIGFDRLSDFCGPALLVHNDAIFTEGDFQSISKIGDSVKRAQAGKTGEGCLCD
jgi:hypothetical protein